MLRGRVKRGQEMKRIVILCDGTWNAAEAPHPTNVVRVAQSLLPEDPQGRAQVPIYVEGVGTGRRAVTPFGKVVDRALGGGLGLGLMENLAEAYRHLVFLYEPGDTIMAFGFSRGAYTARSLMGFIRYTGLLARRDLDRLPEAIARYTTRTTLRGDERQMLNAEWRAMFAPDFVVDPKDREAFPELIGRPEVEIEYVGVWDTVGALGIPRSIASPSSWFNKRFDFHDTDLGLMVGAARHAVALDEKRKEFTPTLWTNLDALEQQRPGQYRQQWFPGDHGGVGGGGALRGLSSGALLWLLEGAQDAGLAADPGVMSGISAEADPLTPLLRAHEVPKGGFFAAAMRRLGVYRDGPTQLVDVHASARARWAGHPAYRPGSLDRVAAELEGLGPPVDPSA